MSDQLPMKPSELKSILKFQGSYNYSLKRFVDIGHLRSALLLQDNLIKEDVLGKIVDDYNEGEFVQWPHLRHENVVLLLDMVSLTHQKTLFIFSFLEKTIQTVVLNASFKFHPKCFDRKRSYCKDVLSGLEYLHQRFVSLVNLNDENVFVCSQSDRALICDLSSAKTISKDVGELECMAFDMWNCGIMFLQMFTMRILPWCQTDHLKGLTSELLRQTNPGSNLPNGVANNLKNFLAPFLQKDPNLRVGAKAALASVFLQSSGKRIDEVAREFWKSRETENRMSNEKFGEVKINCGIKDFYWKRKGYNRSLDKEVSHFTDVKLKKSISNNELFTVARESNSGAISFCKVASENSSNETSPLWKRTSFSEENLGDCFSWIYDQTPAIDASRDARKSEEIEMALKEEFSTNMPKSIQKLSENLNSEDPVKFYTKENCSQISNSTFDLPCHCVFCTGQNLLALNQFLPLPDVCPIATHSVERKNLSFFSQTQGGFLQNNWKAERNCTTDKNCSDFVEDNSTPQSKGLDQKNSINVGYRKHSDKLEFQKISPACSRRIENDRKDSTVPNRKVYPDNNFTSGENQLIFQRFTGIRGFKFKMPPAPTIIARSQSPTFQDEENTAIEKNEVKSDGKITHKVDDENCLKKGKKSKKKDSDEIPSGSDSTEDKAVDIAMELPLFSVNGKPNKVAYKDKAKQKWIRGLCPGSFLEE